ncbi:hypothetical protein KFL_000740220 [Klebsormidium nitens]|uniref:NAD-dependent epimerase/dehydratase domain-containing protein n=1 Tax=Klebsormidium nitens TaxID=105231 RepID=A0A1Y1HTQ3_KLENI|nr:hypothetical protein KFL_000740220 [Klebsormidium nitens]|eukprot:GAQ81222.1 hypothetical protein KFL_000740220 [Klebsormidium nitens]
MAREAYSEGRKEEPGHLFCFGFGYTTLGLANTLKKEGWNVTGTCRSEEKKEALIAKSLPAVIFDTDGEIGLESDGLAALRSATHLIASIPPVGDFDQDPALALHAQQIHEAARNGLSWIGYLSTTGVYGDWDGAWVDESTEPRPSNARAAARLRAEEAWLSIGREANVPVHVFRLGGIYGPSRSAIDVVRSGRPASQTQRVRESRRFTSRCHVADIVQVVTSAMKQPAAGGRVYNVVDGDPATRREVVTYARELLERREAVERVPENSTKAACVESDVTGEERPSGSGEFAEVSRQAGTPLVLEKGSGEAKTEALEHSRPAVDRQPEREESLSRLGAAEERRKGVDEKRVKNDRIKRELVVTLLFPSYKEGLAAIADGDLQPFDEHVGL